MDIAVFCSMTGDTWQFVRQTPKLEKDMFSHSSGYKNKYYPILKMESKEK
jgi:hypothetical protein